MAQMDIDLKVQNEVENQRTLEQQLGSAFDAIDKNNSGYVNSMEFDEVLMQEFVTSWFATVGFDVETPEEKGKLWAVLEAKSPGVHGVEREAFIRTCRYLANPMQKVDLTVLERELSGLEMRMSKDTQRLQMQMEQISRQLEDVAQSYRL